MCRRGENQSTRRKTSRCRGENQQTQPTYDAESGNRTRATLVGGECSHHCAIPAPQIMELYHFEWHSPFKEETSEFHSRACFVIFKLNLLPKLRKVKDLKTGHDITR